MSGSKTGSSGKRLHPNDAGHSSRARVIKAAVQLFCERGFPGSSMLDIATRAQVSKRDLYALFDNKHALLADLIEERAQGMRRLLDASVPVPADRNALAAKLVEFGVSTLTTVCHAEVLMIYRLAIAESDRAPQVGRLLDSYGREANHRALAQFIAKAQARGLIGPGDPAELTARYFLVLWGDLLVRLLLGVRNEPDAKEIAARAQSATEAVIGG